MSKLEAHARHAREASSRQALSRARLAALTGWSAAVIFAALWLLK